MHTHKLTTLRESVPQWSCLEAGVELACSSLCVLTVHTHSRRLAVGGAFAPEKWVQAPRGPSGMHGARNVHWTSVPGTLTLLRLPPDLRQLSSHCLVFSLKDFF